MITRCLLPSGPPNTKTGPRIRAWPVASLARHGSRCPDTVHASLPPPLHFRRRRDSVPSMRRRPHPVNVSATDLLRDARKNRLHCHVPPPERRIGVLDICRSLGRSALSPLSGGRRRDARRRSRYRQRRSVRRWITRGVTGRWEGLHDPSWRQPSWHQGDDGEVARPLAALDLPPVGVRPSPRAPSPANARSIPQRRASRPHPP